MDTMLERMKLTSTHHILADGAMTADGVKRTMQVLKTGAFTDPRYGKFKITKAMLDEMVANFKKGVRGVVPALDYAHEADQKAAGWFRDLRVESKDEGHALLAEIELTPTGSKSLTDKEFGYLSADLDAEYVCNETGTKHGCVLLGAALTNRPVIKGMESVIQLSEKFSLAVAEKVKALVAEGKPQDEAVALAMQMEREGKLGAKPGEGDAARLAAYKKLEEVMGTADPEEMIAMVSKMKAPALGKEKPKMEMEEMTKKLELAEQRLTSLEKEKGESEARAEKAEQEIAKQKQDGVFTKLLAEGKAVEAQREAFMAGDMVKYSELAQSLNSGQGTGAHSTGGATDAETEIDKLALKLAEEKRISYGDAISRVLADNPKLAQRLQAEEAVAE